MQVALETMTKVDFEKKFIFDYRKTLTSVPGY
jgi:hypothetical protein